MADYVVYRQVNLLYFILFLFYTIIFLIRVIPRKKQKIFKNALLIFATTSAVLLAMEVFGTLVGIRVFYFTGEINIGLQLLLQGVMAFGEGGTATGIIYLMIEALHEKALKKYILYMASLAILMITFASFTFLYESLKS